MIYERMFREFLIWSSMEEKDWNYSTLRILAGHLKIRFLEEPSDDFWNNPRNVYGRILGKFLKESSEISDWFLEGFLKHFFLENRLKSSHVFRTNSWSNYEKKISDYYWAIPCRIAEKIIIRFLDESLEKPSCLKESLECSVMLRIFLLEFSEYLWRNT